MTASRSTRVRRILTALTLLAAFAALLGAMGFFVLRDSRPALAIAFGKVVWGGLIAALTGAAVLSLAGVVSALAAPPEE